MIIMKRRKFIGMIPVGAAIPMTTHPLLAALGNESEADVPEWNDPEVLHINTEKPHATLTPFPSRELATKFDRNSSP